MFVVIAFIYKLVNQNTKLVIVSSVTLQFFTQIFQNHHFTLTVQRLLEIEKKHCTKNHSEN